MISTLGLSQWCMRVVAVSPIAVSSPSSSFPPLSPYPLMRLHRFLDHFPPQTFPPQVNKQICYFRYVQATRAHPSLVATLKILRRYFHLFRRLISLCDLSPILLQRPLLPPLFAFFHRHVADVKPLRTLRFSVSWLSATVADLWSRRLLLCAVNVHWDR